MRNCFVFVAAALAACGGKDAPKGNCTTAIDNAVALSKDEYKKDGVTDATVAKIRETSIARCNADKWTPQILDCLVAAKQTDDVVTCQGMMSKDQSENMSRDLTAIMSTQPTQPQQGSGSAAGSAAGSGSAVVESPPGLPPQCKEYQAMVEKLAACDKLPQASRDMLKQTFEGSSKAWSDFDKLPDDAKTALINGCRQGVDALKQTAGAACGF